MGLIVGAAILITVVGIVAMVAINQANKRRHETKTLLFQLEANAQGLNANEWEAIASQKIDPDVQESSGNFRREILNEAQIIHTMQDRDGRLDKVQPAASAYVSTMQQEFGFISNGQLHEARELDVRRVDPDFADLDHAIHEVISEFETESRRSNRIALLTSIGTLLGCLASILLLTFRFERGRNLQKSNVHLQELVTRLSQSQEQLSHLAYHDSLTQLANRALFMDQLTQCVNRTKRHQDYKFAVVLIDVDHFKTVNDTLGHSGGDQLIVRVLISMPQKRDERVILFRWHRFNKWRTRNLYATPKIFCGIRIFRGDLLDQCLNCWAFSWFWFLTQCRNDVAHTQPFHYH
jgi:hypothetical protein